MLITFRLSSMGFGGAERVFLSVADALSRNDPGIVIHFVVDQLGLGETEEITRKLGFRLIGLESARTARSILPFRDYINSFRPDVVISAYTDTNMAMLLSTKLARHKCLSIVTEHASLDEHWQNASWKRRLMLNAFVSIGYRLADHVLTVSGGIARQITQRLKHKTKVSCIHNPVRFHGDDAVRDCRTESAQAGNATILAVGRITQQKDYLNLLSAFRLVLAKRDARLIIVGGVHEAAEKKRLDDFIQTHGLSSKVEFAGYTENVAAFYRTADLFVLSSSWEGFGNVLVEALAFGLPIVSTDCNHGPAEILCNGQYGALVPVGNATALADAIVGALNAPIFDREALRKRSRDFSEERIGAQYWALIEQLLQTR